LADLAELRGLDIRTLETRRAEAKEELFRLRVQHATLQLTATSQLRAIRREIAQVMTVQRERELLGDEAHIPANEDAPVAQAEASEDENHE
jgi:large subunit ribosomal protein L29